MLRIKFYITKIQGIAMIKFSLYLAVAMGIVLGGCAILKLVESKNLAT